jgi:para-nitrobenzyl esterase
MKRSLSALLTGALCWLAVAAQAAELTGIVKTTSGPVQGLVTGPVAEFLGIPYAAPPVGALRWQPPREPQSWSQTLAANHYANFCPQENRGIFAQPSTTEDCLYLNLFMPKEAAGPHGPRPVMVWIYGGGLFSGESNDYDASKLAARGDVVVVTVNYRIGALGFFSHPALNAEGHPFANYGIMDQQFALRWIKRNIARFGGNPDNVTLFGQSGGATAVMANLVSPQSAGLFQRAINESGTHIVPMPPDAALKAGAAFAVAAGCADQSASCLRALPVATVLASQRPNVALIAPDFPVVDGTIIPETAFDAFSTGKFNRVPILTGLVRDEQAFFLPEVNGAPPLTAEGYAHDIASFGAAAIDKLTAQYPLAAYDSPSLADIAMQEGFKSCTARQLDRAWSRYVPVYAYQFNDRTAPAYFPPLSYPMRAYHTSELQYLFVAFHGGQGTPHPLSAAQSRLSDEMIAYWTSFARNGVPSLPHGMSAPRWLRYSPQVDNLQILDLPKPSSTRGYGEQYDCALWDSIVSYR